MKRILLTALVIAWLFTAGIPVRAEEYPKAVQQILDESAVDLSTDPENLPQRVYDWILDVLENFWVEPLRFGARVGAYLILGWVVAAMAAGGHDKTIASITAIGFAALCLQVTAQTVQAACDQAVEWHAYLMSFVPVLSGVMLAGGQQAQAAVYSGAFLGTSALLSEGIRSLLLPCIQIYLCLSTAICFWADPGMLMLQHAVNKGIRLLLKVATWGFSLILGMQTLLAHGSDRVAAQLGVKLLAGAVPVVGGVATQAIAGVQAGLSLLKTLLGAAALVSVSSMVLPVVIPMAVYCGTLILAAALAKGVGLSACGNLAQQYAVGLQLCISCLVLYYFLILLSTILMILTVNGV